MLNKMMMIQNFPIPLHAHLILYFPLLLNLIYLILMKMDLILMELDLKNFFLGLKGLLQEKV